MGRVAHHLILALVAFAMVSCASDVANRYYGSEKFPPKPVAEVQLLDRAPDRPYNVIADLQSRGETAQDLRKKAAAIGADAVIVTTLGGVGGHEWMDQGAADPFYTHIVGTAIRYR
jgi:hypothetical protein